MYKFKVKTIIYNAYIPIHEFLTFKFIINEWYFFNQYIFIFQALMSETTALMSCISFDLKI